MAMIALITPPTVRTCCRSAAASGWALASCVAPCLLLALTLCSCDEAAEAPPDSATPGDDGSITGSGVDAWGQGSDADAFYGSVEDSSSDAAPVDVPDGGGLDVVPGPDTADATDGASGTDATDIVDGGPYTWDGIVFCNHPGPATEPTPGSGLGHTAGHQHTTAQRPIAQ